MAKNAGKKVGTRKQNGGSNKTLTEGRKFVRSRVLQPALEPLSNTVSSNPTVPGTSDHLELSPLTKTSHFRLSTRPMLRSSVVMLSTSQNHRISSIIILVNNMNASKSKKTHRPCTLSVQSLHQESLFSPDMRFWTARLHDVMDVATP